MIEFGFLLISRGLIGMRRKGLATSLALIPWSLLVRVLWLEVAILHVPVFGWIGMVYTQFTGAQFHTYPQKSV